MATTTKGYRYPVAADNNDTATAMLNLATDIDTDAGPFTSAQITAFVAAKKWVGRVVFNSTTSEFWWWDGTAWQIFGFIRGEIREWPSGAGSPPVGWLFAEGAAVSRTTYALLFAIYSTNFGAGDLSTTFNLPNKQGKMSVGRDTGQTEFDVIGESGGAKTKTLLTAELPAHTHTVDHTHTASSGTVANHSHAGSSTSGAGGHTHPAAADAQGVHGHNFGNGAEIYYDNNGAAGFAPYTGGGFVSVGWAVWAHDGSHTHGITVTAVGDHSHPLTVAADGTHGHTVTVNSTSGLTTSSIGSGTAFSMMNPYLVSRFIIKY